MCVLVKTQVTDEKERIKFTILLRAFQAYEFCRSTYIPSQSCSTYSSVEQLCEGILIGMCFYRSTSTKVHDYFWYSNMLS